MMAADGVVESGAREQNNPLELQFPPPHRTLAAMRQQYDTMQQAILDAELEAQAAGYPEGRYLADVIRDCVAAPYGQMRRALTLRAERAEAQLAAQDAALRELEEQIAERLAGLARGHQAPERTLELRYWQAEVASVRAARPKET